MVTCGCATLPRRAAKRGPAIVEEPIGITRNQIPKFPRGLEPPGRRTTHGPQTGSLLLVVALRLENCVRRKALRILSWFLSWFWTAGRQRRRFRILCRRSRSLSGPPGCDKSGRHRAAAWYRRPCPDARPRPTWCTALGIRRAHNCSPQPGGRSPTPLRRLPGGRSRSCSSLATIHCYIAGTAARHCSD